MSISVSVLEDVQKELFSKQKDGIGRSRTMINIEPIYLQAVVELPVDNFHRTMMKRMGFTFYEGNRMKLPRGWSLRVEGTAVNILDFLGRKRGCVYNYQSGDTCKAVVELARRYKPSFIYSDNDTEVSGCIVDNATGRVIYEVWKGKRDAFNAYEISSAMHEYLKRNYPEWEDVCAYW